MAAPPASAARHTAGLKILLLGDAGVGKTSIASRYTKDEFSRRTAATVGVEFYTKTLHIRRDGASGALGTSGRTANATTAAGASSAAAAAATDDSLVEVYAQLWDTAGEEKFRSLAAPVYRGAHAAVVVFDITNRASFANVPYWLTSVRAHAGPACVVAIVGNKLDMQHIRAVPTEEAETIARSFDASFLEVSAATNVNVGKILDTIIEVAYARNALSGGTAVKMIEPQDVAAIASVSTSTASDSRHAPLRRRSSSLVPIGAGRHAPCEPVDEAVPSSREKQSPSSCYRC